MMAAVTASLAVAATNASSTSVTAVLWSSSSSSSSGLSPGDPELQWDQHVLSFLYLSFSVFSLLLSLTVIGSYVLFPSLRGHPNSMVLWRSCCDCLYSAQFIVFFCIQPYSARPAYCTYFTPLFQFSLLASQLWYTALTADLLLSLRNPFLSLSSSPLYHLFVWPLALATAVLIPATGQQGYRVGMEICWIKASETSSVNALTWSIFFAPTLLSFLFALLVMAYASVRLQRGLKETFQTRAAVLANSLRYVASFSLYWVVTGGIYLALWSTEQSDARPGGRGDSGGLKGHFGLYAAFAVTLVLRAALDELTWCFNNGVCSRYRRWCHGEQQVRPVSTDINRALRREVLIFTTNGIMHAAQLQQKQIDAKQLTAPQLPKRSHFPSSLSASSSSSVRRILLRQSSPGGDGVAPSSSAATPFTDYGPAVFLYLRSLWGVSTPSYLASIKGDVDAMLERYSEGRSGAFFFYSQDSCYIVKTLTRKEARTLLTLLPDYVAYMSAQPDSLLCRFVGLHAVVLYGLTLHFVVMQSVFLSSVTIHERYDLKGSTVDRTTGGDRRGKLLKDLDLTFGLVLAVDDRRRFVLQCQHDTHFLCSHGIMDYSLLLGVHYSKHRVGVNTDMEALSGQTSPSLSAQGSAVPVGGQRTAFQRDSGGLRATVITGPSLYLFGIIDVLQLYDWRKRLERWSKVLLRCKDRHGLSAMPPAPYRERFLAAMERITEDEQEVAADCRPVVSDGPEGDDSLHDGGVVVVSMGGPQSATLSVPLLADGNDNEDERKWAANGGRERSLIAAEELRSTGRDEDSEQEEEQRYEYDADDGAAEFVDVDTG